MKTCARKKWELPISAIIASATSSQRFSIAALSRINAAVRSCNASRGNGPESKARLAAATATFTSAGDRRGGLRRHPFARNKELVEYSLVNHFQLSFASNRCSPEEIVAAKPRRSVAEITACESLGHSLQANGAEYRRHNRLANQLGPGLTKWGSLQHFLWLGGTFCMRYTVRAWLNLDCLPLRTRHRKTVRLSASVACIPTRPSLQA